MTPQPPTPQEYAYLFEENKTGARILEQLIQRFSHAPNSKGLDRVLDTQEYMGQQKVLQFIILQINRANGVEDEPTGEKDT